ncbi:MAG: DNA-directed RNA polymerase sigma-70 factor [Ignavibacteriaceae bacterium]|nr:MAG: sigma-70 family RNA polymerase sigma factor [Chlorobiota bacterium]GJQ31375.1 MAG: DNA-directed RNA polymerase sigma-70 factor [Ignavibacteriaceae bacterium]
MTETEKKQFYEQCLTEHKGIFIKVAKSWARTPEDREDILQEMKLNVWRAIGKYDPGMRLSTWLYRVCLNVAISYYRKYGTKQRVTVTVESQEQFPISDRDYTEKEKLDLLWRFIHRLGDLDRAIIILYLEDKPHSEISDILGISKSNVGTRIGRIKETLKHEFEKLEK